MFTFASIPGVRWLLDADETGYDVPESCIVLIKDYKMKEFSKGGITQVREILNTFAYDRRIYSECE